ncbi:MAG: LysM peptidoglycan-binding domain-containing protein [Anaerolineales bacterium]|nr:LysM peptidoglycan-binding domain-containing protein [Anaerolineales bacterium]
MKRKKRIILRFYMVLTVVLLQAAMILPASGALPDREILGAADVIAAINAYRAQNGLYAYQTNSLLMAAAQAQSDYQASIGSVTHTGPGGTRPSDRAYAVGYGDGNTIWVSEIIYGGINATVSDAVGWWKTSQIHNDTMLSPRYIDIGAGVASAGGMVYYTALTGYITGSAAPESSSTTSDTGEVVVAPLVIPVVAAEPQEDGSIVHIVRTGQSLWNIAAVYDVPIEKILELNNLTENSMLQVGQEILVLTASEAASRITPEPGPTEAAAEEQETPSPTPEPIVEEPTRFPTTAVPVTVEPTDIPVLAAASGTGPGVGVVLAVSVVAVFFAFVGLSFTRIDPHERP